MATMVKNYGKVSVGIHLEVIYDKCKNPSKYTPRKRDFIWLNSYEGGVAKIGASAGMDIFAFVKIIAGCFEEISNFRTVVQTIFELEEPFKGIEMCFNDVKVFVNKENAIEENILNEFRSKQVFI